MKHYFINYPLHPKILMSYLASYHDLLDRGADWYYGSSKDQDVLGMALVLYNRSCQGLLPERVWFDHCTTLYGVLDNSCAGGSSNGLFRQEWHLRPSKQHM